ncbi:MAG: efflux RND transporter periplasmic adaptor subunit [Cellulosilyticum sp.]|nr:efflux RND transporter periplasmic adaptor subunit [Cellulosilyticum sp.]
MKNKKMIIFSVVIVVMIAFVGIAIKNKPDTEENIGGDKEGTRVTVTYVEQQNIETKISSSGKLEAVNTKTVYLDATNKIAVLHKEVGDTVKKGELIITLDKEAEVRTQNELEALEKQLAAEKEALNQLVGKGSQTEILNAQATLAELKDSKKTAEQNIKDAQVKLDNLNKDLKDNEEDLATNEELLQVGAVSQKEIDDLKDAIDTIKQNISQQESNIALSKQSLSTIDAKIQTAQYSLDLLQNKVTDSSKKQQIAAKESSIKSIENQIENSQSDLVKTTTKIVAPIDGVLTYLPEEEGMTVSAGSKLMSIVDPSELKVNCDISPYYSADLRLDLDAIIKYTGSKTIEVPGKVSKISAVADVEKTTSGETVTLPVEVSVSEPGEVIKPGFSVDVKIITDTRENVCTVPILAIEEEDDFSYVYVVGEDGTLEKREVVQGLSNGLNIEVSNVEVGEMVVATVEEYITDGMKVSYEKIGDVE